MKRLHFLAQFFYFCSWCKNINGGIGNFFHKKLSKVFFEEHLSSVSEKRGGIHFFFEDAIVFVPTLTFFLHFVLRFKSTQLKTEKYKT